MAVWTRRGFTGSLAGMAASTSLMAQQKRPGRPSIKITDLRYKKYFSSLDLKDSEAFYNGYLDIYLKIGNECKKSGFIFHDGQIEYPLFKDIFSSKIYAMPIYVKNFSNKIPVKERELDCIILVGDINAGKIDDEWNRCDGLKAIAKEGFDQFKGWFPCRER